MAFKKGKRKFPNWKRYGRVVVLIDNANIIHALSTLGWKLDHRKLKDYFAKQTKLQGIYLYSAFIKTHMTQQSFLEMLSRMGYTLRTKEVKFIRQKDGSFIKKGDLDIEIAIDLFEGLRKFDTAVLLSGDSDFAPLVEYLKSKRRKTIVISTRPHISRELARAADLFIDLGKFRKHWELKP
jgi:uncharacterized LabA/DUF88 family protein